MSAITLERAQSYFEEKLEEDREILARDYEQLKDTASELDLSSVPKLLHSMNPGLGINWKYFRERRSNCVAPRLGLVLAHEFYFDMCSVEPSPRLAELGGTLLEYAGLDKPDTTDCKGVKGVIAKSSNVACSNAELYFIHALQQIREGCCKNQPKVSVYHDQDGAPVLLRKNKEVDSALTLRGMEISGVPIVPGTIMGVDERASKEKTGSLRFRKYGFEVATYLLPSDLLVNPIRISPWAYDNPLDRVLFAMYDEEPIEVDRDREERVVSYSIDDFRRCARVINVLCKVASNDVRSQSIENVQLAAS